MRNHHTAAEGTNAAAVCLRHGVSTFNQQTRVKDLLGTSVLGAGIIQDQRIINGKEGCHGSCQNSESRRFCHVPCWEERTAVLNLGVMSPCLKTRRGIQAEDQTSPVSGSSGPQGFGAPENTKPWRGRRAETPCNLATCFPPWSAASWSSLQLQRGSHVAPQPPLPNSKYCYDTCTMRK